MNGSFSQCEEVEFDEFDVVYVENARRAFGASFIPNPPLSMNPPVFMKITTKDFCTSRNVVLKQNRWQGYLFVYFLIGKVCEDQNLTIT